MKKFHFRWHCSSLSFLVLLGIGSWYCVRTIPASQQTSSESISKDPSPNASPVLPGRPPLSQPSANNPNSQPPTINIPLNPSPLPDKNLTSEDSKVSQLERVVSEFSKVQVQVIAPKEINIDEVGRLEVRLNKQAANLRSNVSKELQEFRDEIKVSEEILVVVSGDSVDILPEKKQKQVLDPKNGAAFTWMIAPQKTGEVQLNVEVFALIDTDNIKDGPLRVQSLDHAMQVTITGRQQGIYFWKNNWQWVLGVGGSTCLLLFPLLKGKKKRAKKEES